MPHFLVVIMEEQQWIVTQFLPMYTKNKDSAYQGITNHGVALLNNSPRDLLLKTDGSPMDFTLLRQHISTNIHLGNRHASLPITSKMNRVIYI